MVIYKKTPEPLKLITAEAGRLFTSEDAFKSFIKRIVNDDIQIIISGLHTGKSIDHYVKDAIDKGFMEPLDKNKYDILKSLLDDLSSKVIMLHLHDLDYSDVHLIDFNISVMIYAVE